MTPAASHAEPTRRGRTYRSGGAALAAFAAATATAVALAAPPEPHADARSYAVAQNDKPTSVAVATPPPPAGANVPLNVAQLQTIVPERIGAWKRSGVHVPQSRKRGLLRDGPSVVYDYKQGKLLATLTLSDLGGMGSAAGLAQWQGEPADQQTATGSDKVYREGRHTVREVSTRASKTREVNVVLDNGIVIVATSEQADFAALKSLVDAAVPGAEAISRTPR